MMKRVRTILVVLLLGAIVNVAVAWVSAAWVDGWPLELMPTAIRGASRADDSGWEITIVRTPTSTVISFFPSAFRGPRQPRADASDEEVEAWLRDTIAHKAGRPLPRRKDVSIVQTPGWSRAATPPDPTVTARTSTLEDARGWPMRSMVSYLDPSSDPAAASPPDCRLDFGDTQGPMDLPRGLPFRPIAPGFAVNTLFFAAIAGASLIAGRSLRRAIRRRRGQCIHCAYDLRAAPPDRTQCPECGRRLAGGIAGT